MASESKITPVQQSLALSIEPGEIADPDQAHFPTILSSAPFFKPGDRSKSDTVGWEDEDGESFRVKDLEWIRFGPGLDTYDLATLVAILQIVNTRVKGPAGTLQRFEQTVVNSSSKSLPAVFDDIDGNSDVSVTGESASSQIWGVTTPHAINRYLGRGVDNVSWRCCDRSVRRLAKTQNHFINHRTGRSVEAEHFFHLTRNKSGAMVIRIPAQMSRLLAHFLTFDMTIYQQLSPLGQAMMLWMNPHEGEQVIPLEEARTRSSFSREMKKFKYALAKGSNSVSPILPKMVDLGFLKGWEIIGTGRKTPFILHYERPARE